MQSPAPDGDATVPGRGGNPAETTGPTRTAELPADDDDSLLRGVAGMAPAAGIEIAEGEVLGGRYTIGKTLGAGGMGTVYLARDRTLHRDVAIKVHAAHAEDPDGVRLFREATAIAQLAHPHVVTVHEVGTWRGHPYVAMEYVAGGTLRTWLRAAPRDEAAIVAQFIVAGRGLSAAHERGLVHRDFKPDNVLVGDDGRLRVADFGLACEAGTPASRALLVSDGALDSVTRTGSVMGTPAYMAPEQKDGGAVGPAADQYAFAVALWEAIEGARPATPPVRGQHMSRAVARALERALSPRPADRWPTLDALLERLTAPARAPRLGVLAAAIGVLAIGGGITIAIERSRDHALAHPPSFVGLWGGSFGPMVIRQDGDQLIGAYQHDQGLLRGHLVGRTFVGWWCEAPTRQPPADAGDVQLELGVDTTGTLTLRGRWRYGAGGSTWVGGWDGTAMANDPPADLLARLADASTACVPP